ncbi:hypothetical protein [Streptomyces sp. NPDC002851]
MEPTDLPRDLVQAQHDWNRTYEALAVTPPTQGTTTLRRRLLRLSNQIARHHAKTSAPAGELRRQARESGNGST